VVEFSSLAMPSCQKQVSRPPSYSRLRPACFHYPLFPVKKKRMKGKKYEKETAAIHPLGL